MSKHKATKCKYCTGEIIRRQCPSNSDRFVNLTYCRNPENAGIPFARLVPADSCQSYPVSLKKWCREKDNQDEILPIGCRFFDAKPNNNRNDTEDNTEDNGLCIVS